jgi:hypothetical protein
MEKYIANVDALTLVAKAVMVRIFVCYVLPASGLGSREITESLTE